MTDAVEAARRIVEQRRNPVNIDLYVTDANIVVYAYLASVERERKLRDALRRIAMGMVPAELSGTDITGQCHWQQDVARAALSTEPT